MSTSSHASISTRPCPSPICTTANSSIPPSPSRTPAHPTTSRPARTSAWCRSCRETPVESASRSKPTCPQPPAACSPATRSSAMDGVKLHSVPALLAYMQDQDGRPAALNVTRSGASMTLLITPQLADSHAAAQNNFRLGFRAVDPPTDIVHLPLGGPAAQGLGQRELASGHPDHPSFSATCSAARVSVKNFQAAPSASAQEIGLAVQIGGLVDSARPDGLHQPSARHS